LLSATARGRLFGLPAHEREVIRYATLSPDDLALVASRRGSSNQLGFAVTMVCLRYPGRALEANEEAPPQALLDYLAQQLDVDVGAFAAYARRDQTRRAHLAELSRRLGLLVLDRAAFRTMIDWELPLASALVQTS
jgi:TnpA family transposase